MEALKAASHRKRFGCGLKRAALLKWEAPFFGGPPSLELRSRPKGPRYSRPHLRVGRKEASESAGRHPLLKAGPSRRKTTTLCWLPDPFTHLMVKF